MFGKKKGSDTEDKEVKKAKKEKKPKREKKPKEPKQKKEKKPKGPKKPKEPKKPRPPKKPKPPKRPRPKKPKKPKKKLNPLILVIILLALMVVAAAGALVMMMKQREKEEDEMYGPMFYFTEEDAIESIRSKIGDREIKGGYQPPVDLTAETPTPEGESEEDKEDKDKKEDQKDDKDNKDKEEEEDKEKEEDPELAEVDIKLLTDQHLSYITPGDGIKEAEEYITYLVQEKGFKILTYPKGAEGEIPKEAPQPTQAEEEKKEDEEEDSGEEDGFTPPEEGYYIAALDDKATAEEGEATEIKRVRMEYTYDSYTLRLSTANGVVSDLIPPEPEEEKGPKEVTLSDAVVKLQGMASGILQLPKPTAEYEMTPIQGRVVLEDIDFYCVRAYEEGPEDTLIYGGSYYVSNDGESIYKHDEMTGKIICISGKDILAQARKQNKKKKVNENAAVLSGNQ